MSEYRASLDNAIAALDRMGMTDIELALVLGLVLGLAAAWCISALLED